jgi:hypothetical protein
MRVHSIKTRYGRVTDHCICFFTSLKMMTGLKMEIKPASKVSYIFITFIFMIDNVQEGPLEQDVRPQL